MFCDGVPGGGMGVFVADNDPRNVCEKLWEREPQTERRAALKAFLRALQRVGTFEDATIYCGMQFIVDGVNFHLPKWERSKWRSEDSTILADVDLWQHIAMCYRPTIRVLSVCNVPEKKAGWHQALTFAHTAAKKK